MRTRLPGGLTIDEASGQHRDRHSVIECEGSYELYLLYPASQAPARGKQIEEIRRDFHRRFQQASVTRIDEHARVDF